MRGRQTSPQNIYNIMASYALTGNYNQTSRDLGIPQKTVEQVHKANMMKPEFTKLHLDKNAEFVEKATKLINIATDRLEQTLLNPDEKILAHQLSTVIGTLYDKRALSNGQATENTEIKIVIDEQIKELGV